MTGTQCGHKRLHDRAESEIAVTKVSSTLTFPLIDCKNTKTPANRSQLYENMLAIYYNGGHTSSRSLMDVGTFLLRLKLK